MVYLKKIKDPKGYFAIKTPLYVRKQSNGMIVLCNSATLAQGVLSPDGERIWQLAGRTSLGGEYEEVQIITEAEYFAWLTCGEEDPDPEDTEPQIPENVAPETILTRAELTEKVNDLEEAVDLLLGGVTEDE